MVHAPSPRPRAQYYDKYSPNISNVSYQPHNPSKPYYPRGNYQRPIAQFPNNYGTNGQNGGARPSRPPRDTRPLPNFNVPKAELFKELMAKNLLGPQPARQLQPPFPAWYKLGAHCEYHMGVEGHDIEQCDAFRLNVLRLLDNGYISLGTHNHPNITTNPLPAHHQDGQVSAIEEDEEFLKDVEDLKVPLAHLLTELENMGYQWPKGISACKKDCHEEGHCAYHGTCVGHDVEACPELKEQIQKMMMLGIIRKEEKEKIGNMDVCGVNNEAANSAKKSLLIINERMVDLSLNSKTGQSGSLLVINRYPQPTNQKPVAVVQVPTPFPYESNKAVPWKYGINVEYTTSWSPQVSHKEENEDCTNLAAASGITRSGRIYSRTTNGGLIGQGNQEERKDVVENSEGEFLKIIKQSEYSIVEQMKKTPSRISLLELVLHSEIHRKALLKVLTDAYVQPDISSDTMVNLVDVTRNANMISFSEQEICPTSSSRPKALHLALRCCGYEVARVLIDGGSALNVIPLCTLQKLEIDLKEIKTSNMIVRAFDGTRRAVFGEINLPLEIGPNTFSVEFQVMDIEAAYTMLLGRPWIHEVRAVPSTLHQRVKYIDHGRIVTIMGEEGSLLCRPNTMPYVDCAEQSKECAFQNFEAIGDKGKEVDHIAARIMEKSGFEVGKGLGANLQGVEHPIALPENPGHQGLGYDPKAMKVIVGGRKVQKGKEPSIPHLHKTFPGPSEVINAANVIAIMGEVSEREEERAWIRPITSRETPNNWSFEVLPDIMNIQ